MTHYIYTVSLPNKRLTNLFADYVDAVNWQDIMDGNDIVLIHVDHATYNALSTAS